MRRPHALDPGRTGKGLAAARRMQRRAQGDTAMKTKKIVTLWARIGVSIECTGDEAKKLVMGEIPLSSLIRKRKVTIHGETYIPNENGELDEIVGEDGDYPEELDTSDIQGKAIRLVTPNPSYEKERRMER